MMNRMQNYSIDHATIITMLKLCILAGEVSGDMHAAALINEIKKCDPNTHVFGMGGDKLRGEGVEIISDVTAYSSIGLLEPLKYIHKYISAYFTMRKALKSRDIDMVIAVDNQGFNMPLLKMAKKLGKKTAYYISPQEWHWGTEEGGKGVLDVTDLLLAIFPEEEAFYKRLGGNVVYVGHPIVDTAKPSQTKEGFFIDSGLSEDLPILSIFPGSRKQEIKHTAPVLFEAAALIQKEHPNYQVVVSIVKEKFESDINTLIRRAGLTDVYIFKKDSRNLISNTTFSLTTSGTITLEHAVLGTPCCVAYKFGSVSFKIAKAIMMKRLGEIPFMSLPNLIENKCLQDEFLQDKAQPKHIADTALSYLNNEKKYTEYKEKLAAFKEKMGSDKVVSKLAQAVVKFLT
jgi:lipid-A-disaccharide synthase